MSKSSCKIVDFFMGANTSEGFHSYFGGFDLPKPGFRRYLIKGGPGTGKSHMMKQVMAAAMQENLPGVLERIHCSSDADSLDAFLWEAKRCAVFDATPPHAVEPKFPGAYDRVIPITACWDDDMLEAAQAPIVELSRRISRLHERCQVLLSAQNMLYLQNQLSLSGYWQEEKLRRSSLRFAKRLLYGLTQPEPGEEKIRMLTAVTNQGIITYTGTVQALADKIVCIKDAYGVVAQAYLDAVRAQAKKQRLTVILCMSAFHAGQVEHIIFPNQRIAVVTEDVFQKFSGLPSTQTIRISRYLPAKSIQSLKPAIRHRTRMMEALVADAAGCLRQAKELHDKLEGYYTPAVDFDQVDAWTARIIAQMKKETAALRTGQRLNDA